MTTQIEKYTQLAEQALNAGQYTLALKYLNLAIELAEQEDDEEAIMKLLLLIRTVTGILHEQKETLSKKTGYSLEKQVKSSELLSSLMGLEEEEWAPKKDKPKMKARFKLAAERARKAEERRELSKAEGLMKEISDQLQDVSGGFHFMRPAFPVLGDGAVEKERAKGKKKRKEAKKAPAEISIPEKAVGVMPSRPPAMAGPPRAPAGAPPKPKAEPSEEAAAPPPPPMAAPEPTPMPSIPALRTPIVPSQPPADEELAEDEEEAGEGLAYGIPATEAERPAKIKRFGDVSAPMEMTEKKEYLINIGLRVFKEDVIGMPVPMTISVPKVGPPIVEVLVIGQDFKVDQPRRSLIVPLDTDSDILNFRVTPQKDGIRSLTVEFYQEGTLIGRAILKIVVKKKKEPVNEALSSTSVTVASQFGETRLDATLRIVRYGEDFFFSLFTPRASAVVSQSSLFGKATVKMSKVQELEEAMEEAVFDRGNPEAALARLQDLGAQVYESIPKQIRKTIQSIEPKYLMIETGDLLVPWELAYDGEDFLCSKYCLGKRVFDETRDFRPPPFCIGKKILDLVFIGASPQNVPEISVTEELDLFDVYEQTERIHLRKLIEPDAKKGKVLEVLNQGDVIHLTCHGKFEEKEPLDSALLLSDDILTADEIDDMEMSNWPLIFANACSTGAISDKIVGIGGIARAFLEAGAIAFLGPLFEIPDDIALDFAKEFYNGLLYNDENVGEAILSTRKELREKYGGVFWAIFSLYGDPTLNLCKA
ncbi:MAG: CHAT domain-containing protein [Candidatus Helarchaeota archaeon]|nr:CHAT domain-containing protein [Candidatus Helarchaeota archaeon]